MRENEVLRRKRDLEFQARVLAAVEKPKPKALWSALNSPFFIWLLTAGLVTLGSAYFSASRECLADSQKVIESLSKVDAEIAERQAFILHAARSAKTLSDFKKALSPAPKLYVEFSARSLFELLGQRVRLVQKVDLGSDDLLARLESEWQKVQPGLANEKFETIYAEVLLAGNLDQLTDGRYSKIYDNVTHYFDDTIWYNFDLLTPSCSLSEIISSVMSFGRFKVAHFPTGNYYDTSVPDALPESNNRPGN